jgi:hypothetical protein
MALAACGTDVAGPSSTLLSCVYGDAVSPEPGAVIQVRGDAHADVCLEGASGSEFVYVPFFATADTGRSLDLEVTGAGVNGRSATAAPELSRVRLGSGLADRTPQVRSHAFHDRLRQREIDELGPKIRPGPAAAPTFDRAPDVPAVGELRDFNVAISCSDVDLRTGRTMYVSDHAVVYADTANPADLTSDDYAYFGVTFDTLVYRVETEYFGVPTDIDNNGRAILFFTRAVNERNPPGSEAVTIGFFWSGDLFPEESTARLEACPESNHGEMFYLIAPDPNGEAGVSFTLDRVRDLAIPLIGHEFQHLINASRRLFVNNANTFEAPWLNEGLSHIAEELLYFEVSGLGSGQNLGIDAVRNARAPADTLFNRYMGPNFTNFFRFAARPDTASLMGPANELATRGAIWHFLRYASDRSPASDAAFFFDLANGTGAGLDNLDRAIGTARALDWMHDWTVSIFADDFVPGIEPRFGLASWNLRSLYGSSSVGTYPLTVRALGSDGTLSTDLPAGGTFFGRFTTADGRAALHVEAAGGRLPATLYGSLLRIQ